MSTEMRQFPDFLGVKPLKLYKQYRATEDGKILESSTRFGRFQEPLDNSSWEGLLGADVNNGQHMKLMYGLTRLFVTEHNARCSPEHALSFEEQQLLCIAAAIHDQAEARVGDIPAPMKSESDHDTEMRILVEMINESVYDEFTKALCLRAVEEVIRDPQTKLGRMFAAIEQIGYMRTAIRAWNVQSLETDLPVADSQQDEVCQNLQSLAGDVKFGTLPRLEQAAIEYPAVALFLQENAAVISEMPSMKYNG